MTQISIAKKRNYYLDARLLLCPEPVMMVRQSLRNLRTGDILEVHTTDPSTIRDFQDFCRFMGHTLYTDTQSPLNEYHFFIQKGPDPIALDKKGKA